MSGLNIAVIGAGISGLSAAWLLSQKHRVTLYEKDSRPGGHANTFDINVPEGLLAVDTGFIVYNPPAYPNLVQLFDHLGVATHPSDMSLAISHNGGTYEYSGGGLAGFFGQPANVFKPSHWSIAIDMARFFREAKTELAENGESLGEFLSRRHYSAGFIEHHLLPMAGAIWSSHPNDMLSYPAAAFFRFFLNHGLLQFTNRPQWRTVSGGSRHYIEKLLAKSDISVRLSSQVSFVSRRNGRPSVGPQPYDHVVIATHADQALALLADPTSAERKLLGAVPYTQNRAVLHRDASFMPRRRRLWSSWNVTGSKGGKITLTYWMNRLQNLKTSSDVFVTLNPEREPSHIDAEFNYAHPRFSASTIAAQRELWSLQGKHNTWFCGAWFGAGFHEDGLQAGLAVAEQLGGQLRPWQLSDPSSRIYTHKPDFELQAAAG